MATGIASWKLAKGLYIVPMIMAYTPFLAGDWLVSLTIFGFAVFGIYALAAALQGCMERPIGILFRALCFAAGLACLWPNDLVVNAAGVVAVIALLAWNIKGPDPRVATA